MKFEDLDLTNAHTEIVVNGDVFINTADLIDWIAETKNDPQNDIVYIHSENARTITISDCGPIHQGHTFTYTDYINYLGDEIDDMIFRYLQAVNPIQAVAA